MKFPWVDSFQKLLISSIQFPRSFLSQAPSNFDLLPTLKRQWSHAPPGHWVLMPKCHTANVRKVRLLYVGPRNRQVLSRYPNIPNWKHHPIGISHGLLCPLPLHILTCTCMHKHIHVTPNGIFISLFCPSSLHIHIHALCTCVHAHPHPQTHPHTCAHALPHLQLSSFGLGL